MYCSNQIKSKNFCFIFVKLWFLAFVKNLKNKPASWFAAAVDVLKVQVIEIIRQ